MQENIYFYKITQDKNTEKEHLYLFSDGWMDGWCLITQIGKQSDDAYIEINRN